MKNKANQAADDPLDREIDFSRSRPNPYLLGMVDRSCVRLVDKDLTDMFPDNASVNAALRAVADAARSTKKKSVSARRASVSETAGKKSRRS